MRRQRRGLLVPQRQRRRRLRHDLLDKLLAKLLLVHGEQIQGGPHVRRRHGPVSLPCDVHTELGVDGPVPGDLPPRCRRQLAIGSGRVRGKAPDEVAADLAPEPPTSVLRSIACVPIINTYRAARDRRQIRQLFVHGSAMVLAHKTILADDMLNLPLAFFGMHFDDTRLRREIFDIQKRVSHRRCCIERRCRGGRAATTSAWGPGPPRSLAC
mmetsp:Transcript_55440/g.168504  ORF Transcript_55440/g.168504 Transcript_55440/m.168504 type:complete len:212 (+) Transcript_55440:392-1027(+)